MFLSSIPCGSNLYPDVENGGSRFCIGKSVSNLEDNFFAKSSHVSTLQWPWRLKSSVLLHSPWLGKVCRILIWKWGQNRDFNFRNGHLVKFRIRYYFRVVVSFAVNPFRNTLANRIDLLGRENWTVLLNCFGGIFSCHYQTKNQQIWQKKETKNKEISFLRSVFYFIF